MFYLPEYPSVKHPRKRHIMLVLSEDRKTFKIENVTEHQAKGKDAIMMSWLMTTRAANATERYVKDALTTYKINDDEYLHTCDSILQVWLLGEDNQYPFLEWV